MASDPSSLCGAIARRAARRPDQPAVCDAWRSMTAAELWGAAARAATTLLDAGVRPGHRVAVLADKRVESVAVMVAALRCRAAFVPIDPGAPAGRIEALVRDAAPQAVVGRGAPITFDDALAAEPCGDDDLPPLPHAADIAYCMYTSGSTGQPKGVQIHHGAIAAFLAGVDRLGQVDDRSRFLNTSPFFFDASLVDVWYPLAMGATVHLADHFLVPDRILDIIERERITHVGAVASVLALLRRARRSVRARDMRSVVRVLTGAEVLDPAVARDWLACGTDVVVVNGYGPTEAACCCFAHAVTNENVDDVPYPIGRPFPGVRARVVGTDGAPCHPGSLGELLLAGPQVTPGYLGRPEENDTKFVAADGDRWYRTGDLVVEGDDGVFTFKGRSDHELKVRGYRIHPAEVVTALQACEGVAEAHVTAATDERGERILVAAVAPHDEVALSVDALQTRLREVLPDYMVPRRILVLATLPKLPSGKVDDRALATAAASTEAER